MYEKEDSVFEIDLVKLLWYFLGHWRLILLVAIAAAVGAFGYTRHFVTPMYQSHASFYVNSTSNLQDIHYVTSSTISAAQQLVEPYINVLISDTVLEEVARQGDWDMTAEELRQKLSVRQMGESEMFRVYVYDADPKQAQQIVNTIADVAPPMIAQVIDGSSTKIVDRGKLPRAPYSPNVKKNMMMASLVSCTALCGFLLLRYLFDYRLRDEDDVAQHFDCPVLATIPDFNEEPQKHERYEYTAHHRPVKEGRV